MLNIVDSLKQAIDETEYGLEFYWHVIRSGQCNPSIGKTNRLQTGQITKDDAITSSVHHTLISPDWPDLYLNLPYKVGSFATI